MNELTEQEREIALEALWRYQLEMAQLDATATDVTTDALAAIGDVVVVIHAAVTKLGGNPALPLFGLLAPPSSRPS